VEGGRDGHANTLTLIEDRTGQSLVKPSTVHALVLAIITSVFRITATVTPKIG
jgi:hypothetical protein